ncbi:hypothetical protein XAP6164_570014 [Xanthomonas phaseoli pv. phaseoli]|nr:hypothetical protein XAP6164_570014 [Xanthomonas phaseoli pv. phaseoli]
MKGQSAATAQRARRLMGGIDAEPDGDRLLRRYVFGGPAVEPRLTSVYFIT